MPTDDDRAAEPDLAIDAVEYRLVWQHANAWGGDAYADWFCQIYVTVASSLVDLPAHSFAWRRYPGDAARGMSMQDGQPFTPAEAAPLTLCDRCRAPSQPAGAWNFNKRDGTCLRDLVCPNCGLASHQSGSWNPANWQESSLVKKRMGRDAGCAGGQAVAERNVQSESYCFYVFG